MTDPKDLPPDFTDLRRRAEERLAAEDISPEELSPDQATRLIHELRVHQIELEMQNDELRRSQALLEESRTKYADLYDFAPVGYLTLDPRGKIVEANLTAATLLGVERSKLLNRFFSRFLVEADRRAFRQLMNNGLNQTERRGEFHLQDGNGDVRIMLLDILLLTDAEGREQRRISMTDITKLKRTQEELRLHQEDLEELVLQRTAELIETNERLREANDNLEALFKAAPLAIGVFDAEGKILQLNPASEGIFGWSQEEVQGRLPRSIPQEDQEESLAVLQRVLQGESFVGAEIKQQRQDGSLIDVSFSAAPLYDAHGNPRGFIGLAEDVTERKKLEEATRTQARVLESMAEGVAVTDARGQIVYTNPAFDAMFGYTTGELLGRHSNILNFYPPEENTTVVKEILSSVNTTGLWCGEFHNRKKKGKPFFTFARISALEAGGKKLFISVQEDITRRKRVEDTLRRQAELLDLAHDAILVRDAKGRIIYWNQGAARHYGWPKEAALGQDCHKLLNTEFPRPLAEIESLLLDQGFWEGELIHTSRHGRHLVMNSRWSLKRDARGKVVAILEIGHDITAQKQIEKEVHRLASFPHRNPNPVLEMDEDGRVRYANPAARKSAAQLKLSDGVDAFVPPDLKERLARAREGGPREYSFDLRLNGAIFAAILHLPHDLPTARLYLMDITERKKAEEAHKESEDRFRAFMDNSTTIAWAKDEDGRIVYLDKTFENRFGVRLADCQGKTDFELFPQEMAEKFRKGDLAVLASGQPLESIEETVNPDGGRCYWLISKFTFEDAGGKRYVGGIGVDITERKQAEAELDRVRYLLAEGQRIAHLGSWEYIAATQTTVWSDEEKRIYGLDPAQPSPDYEVMLRHHIHPDDAAELDRSFRAAFQHGAPFENENRIIRPDGTVRWIYNKAQPYFDEHGKLLRYVGATLDITERKEAEEALRENEARLRLASRAGRVGLYEWNTSLDRAHWSPEAYELFGIAPHLTANFERWINCVHPDDRERLKDNVAKLLERTSGWKQGTSYHEEYRVVHGDGTILWLEATNALDLKDGEQIVWGAVRDITERKEAEAALRESEARLRLALDAAYVISFEWDIRQNQVRRFTSSDPTLGPTPEQAPSTFEAVRQAVHPEDRELFTANVLAALSSEDGRYENEFRIVHPDGEVAWLFERGYAERDEQGRPARLIGLSQNITRRRQAEEERARLSKEVAEERDKLKALVESITDEVWYCDAAGNLRPMNRAAARAFGREWLEDHGDPLETFMNGFDIRTADGRPRPLGEAPLLRSLRGETVRELEETVFSPTGQMAYRLVSTAPIRDRDGLIVGAVGVGRDITDRKQAEAALRESEHRFRQVVESLPQLVWTCQPDGPCDFLSKQWVEYTGIPEAEQLGYGWLQQVHPDDRAGYMQAWKNATATGADFRVEFRLRRHDGSYRWFDTRAVPLRDENGNILKWFGTNTDIQAQREVREDLRRSEKTFRSLAEANLVGVGFGDSKGQVSYINDEMLRMMGYTRADYEAGRINWEECIAPEYRADNQRLMEQLRQEGQITNTERAYLRPDGGRTPYMASAALVDPDKDFHVSIALDLTEIRAAEQAIRESEERFRAAVDHFPNVYIIYDRNRRIQFINKSGLRISGRPVSDFLGKRDEEVWPEEVTRHYLPHLLRTWETRQTQTFEMTVGIPGGETYTQIVTYVPLVDEQGEIREALGITFDITERKQAEEALRESREDLNRAQAVGHIGSWRLDVRKNKLTWSDENHRIFGIPPGALMTYETFLGIVHPDDREYVDREWTAALHGAPYDIEHRIVVDGALKWVRERAELEFDPEGQLLGGFGTTQDITGRKEMEEALRRAHDKLEARVEERTATLRGTYEQLVREIGERQQAEYRLGDSEARFAAFMENLPGLAVMRDVQGRYLFANRAWEETMGLPPGAWQGKTPADLWDQEWAAELQNSDFQVISSGEATEQVEVHLLADGPRHFLTKHFPIQVAEGLAYMVGAIAIDITARQRAEEALKESERKLRYLAEQLLTAQENERKRLASELHDELGHALLALKLHLSSIEKKLPREQQKVKEEIRGQLDYIQEVIEEVRRLYHDLSPGDLEDLGLTKALLNLIHDFAGHVPKIIWDIDLTDLEGLFPPPVQTIIYRIVQEALTNIGKHAHAEVVTICATKEFDQVHFVIQDDGAGFNVQEVGSRQEGRGLGLAAMEERLKMVGGSFEIHSREQEGARLSFTVPTLKEGGKP